MIGAGFTAALLLTLALGGSASSAPDSDGAKALVDRAKAEFKLARYPAALGLFEEVYRQKQVAGLLFNIGQCKRLQGDLEGARKAYQGFLDAGPGEKAAAAARERLVEVEAALALPPAHPQRAATSVLRVGVEPSGEGAAEAGPLLRAAAERAILAAGQHPAAAGGADLLIHLEVPAASLRTDGGFTVARVTARVQMVDEEGTVQASLEESAKDSATEPAEARRRAFQKLSGLFEAKLAGALKARAAGK